MRVRPRTRLQMHSGNDLNRWTISFADFMTLMFAVFVVLYAVSLSNEEKHKEVLQSIQNASQLLNQSVFSSKQEGILVEESNNLIEDAGPAIISSQGAKLAHDELSDIDTLKSGLELNQIKEELESAFLSELKKDQVTLKLEGDWLTIEMGGNMLFAGGSHALLLSAQGKITKLAKVLIPINNMLRIRGYTDQKIISNEIYRSNWELSGARAFSVLHLLKELGIAGERMVVEAYGEYYPVIKKDGNVDSLKSRRVVVAISKYALVSRNVTPDSQEITDEPELPELEKPDSEEMRELYLPNNRLIITTRQE